MPVIFFPIQFFVLTGFYEIDLAVTIFSAGLLNLISNYYRNLVPQKSGKARSVVPSRLVQPPAELRPVAAYFGGRGTNA
jgi:hypothetical protein